MTKKRMIYLAPLLAVAVSTLLISACSESDKKTVTQQVDEKPAAMMTEVNEAVSDSGSEMSQSVAATTDETKEKIQTKSEELVESGKATVAEVNEAVTEQAAKVEKSVEKKVAQVDASADAVVDQAKMLTVAKESGCLACHSVDNKVVGPAWKDVGAKYRELADGRAIMIGSVTKGSMGKWGTIPMPAYSPRVSDTTIASLVDFILTLK